MVSRYRVGAVRRRHAAGRDTLTISEAVEAHLRRQAMISPRCVLSAIGSPLCPRSPDGVELRMAKLVDSPDPLAGLTPLQLRVVLAKHGGTLPAGPVEEDEEEELGWGHGKVKVGRRRRREVRDYQIARALKCSCEEVRRLLREAGRAIARVS